MFGAGRRPQQNAGVRVRRGGGMRGGRGGRGADALKEISDSARHYNILVDDDDPMTLSYSKGFSSDPGSYQYLTHALSSRFKYYEIEILDSGAECRIGLGLAGRDYPFANMPGWRRDSVGYHADDGFIFEQNGHGRKFGPTCSVGDRMGCGVEFEKDASERDEDLDGVAERKLSVYFTCNGERVGSEVQMTEPAGGLFPLVAMHSEGESIRVDLEAGSPNPDGRQVVMRELRDVQNPAPKWRRLSHVRQTEHRLHYTSPRDDRGIAQYQHAVSHRWPYFELEIVNEGQHCYVAIGVADQHYPLHQFPGWVKHSVAYHADDGKLFNSCGEGRPFGPVCRQGDRMGCGIYFRPKDKGIEGDWDPSSSDEGTDDEEDAEESSGSNSSTSECDDEDSNEDRRVYVYFTHNGTKIGGCASVIPAGGFFPTIGMMSRGEVVQTHMRAITG